MTSITHAKYLNSAIHAAIEAGEAIMEVYQSDFSVETKEDKSPLTLADKRAHDIIISKLEDHGIPYISEEGKAIPYAERAAWRTMWIVDPLDGTKEFVKRNGEFTVNIALVQDQQPVLGVVYAPVKDWLYFASKQIGAFKINEMKQSAFKKGLHADTEGWLEDLMESASKLPAGQTRKKYTIVGSRSHGTPDLEAFVAAKKEAFGEVEFIAAGSSLKICLVAEGAADIYPRLAPTMEWDTAAGQAVAECSGARVYIYDDGKPLKYNREDMLNPWFIVDRLE